MSLSAAFVLFDERIVFMTQFTISLKHEPTILRFSDIGFTLKLKL